MVSPTRTSSFGRRCEDHCYREKVVPKLEAEAAEMAVDRFNDNNCYPERFVFTEKAWDANLNEFPPFTKYPWSFPVKIADYTNLEFARKTDAKSG